MSTRAVITFKDAHHEFSVYQHCDGYPDGPGVLSKIEASKPYAWELPRFEASDFAAAYIRANKDRGGGVYVTSSADAHGDLAYSYVVTCKDGDLIIKTTRI